MPSVSDDAKIAVDPETNKVERVPKGDQLPEASITPPDDWERFTETDGDAEYYYEDRDGTGTKFWTAKPDPSEAIKRLRKQAEDVWGLNRAQRRGLLKKYAIYEYINSGNYEEAKQEADDAADPSILGGSDITSDQRDWIHDMLNGVV